MLKFLWVNLVMIVIMWVKESLGYVDIPLGDVVTNRRINEKYQLIDSARGKIQVELEWRTTG